MLEKYLHVSFSNYSSIYLRVYTCTHSAKREGEVVSPEPLPTSRHEGIENVPYSVLDLIFGRYFCRVHLLGLPDSTDGATVSDNICISGFILKILRG